MEMDGGVSDQTMLPAPRTQISMVLTAAMHSQCRCWVNRCGAIQPLGRSLSVVGQIATKLLRRSECSDVPIAALTPSTRYAKVTIRNVQAGKF
jgi:hypothetical protein